MSNQSIEVPKHLESTYKMILSAYPKGVKEIKYLPLIAVLYEYMSDRNLAEVISLFTGKDYAVVINDLYRTQSTDKPSDSEVEIVKQELLPFGFEEWTEED